MSKDPDMESLSDAELIDRTESAIYAEAVLSSRGRYSDDNWTELDALATECRRRTPNGRLYIIAYNRATAGVIPHGFVPPDPREEGQA